MTKKSSIPSPHVSDRLTPGFHTDGVKIWVTSDGKFLVLQLPNNGGRVVTRVNYVARILEAARERIAVAGQES